MIRITAIQFSMNTKNTQYQELSCARIRISQSSDGGDEHMKKLCDFIS